MVRVFSSTRQASLLCWLHSWTGSCGGSCEGESVTQKAVFFFSKLQHSMHLHKYTTNQANWPITFSSLITLLQKKKNLKKRRRGEEHTALLKNNLTFVLSRCLLLFKALWRQVCHYVCCLHKFSAITGTPVFSSSFLLNERGAEQPEQSLWGLSKVFCSSPLSSVPVF